MKGIELSRLFYNEFGAPMIHTEFPELEPKIAVGIAGSGSECFGYDDEISKDHDFKPGFCMFVPDNLPRKTLFELERAYSKLPKEFMGFKRDNINPTGGDRHGVISMGDFFEAKTGNRNGELSLNDWFFVPEQSVSEAVNGKIFRDDEGIFSDIRQKLSYMPQDVRLKKLAGNLLVMGQSGQYNYKRACLRGDTAAAQLCVYEFVKSSLNVIFLLNKTYIPYYKWVFRALSDLPLLSELYNDLEYLISSGNKEEAVKKEEIIEKICTEIISKLNAQNLTNYRGNEAEGHAYLVNNRIKDPQIRNLHILYAV